MNSCSFYMPGHSFVSPLVWKVFLPATEFKVDCFFHLRFCFCFVFFTVIWLVLYVVNEKFDTTFTFVSLYVTCLFSPDVFKTFSLRLVLNSFILCHGVVFFTCFVAGIHWVSCISGFIVFNNYEKFLAIISLNSFLFQPSFLFFRAPNCPGIRLLISCPITHWCLLFCVCTRVLFYLSFLLWLDPIFIPWSSLIFCNFFFSLFFDLLQFLICHLSLFVLGLFIFLLCPLHVKFLGQGSDPSCCSDNTGFLTRCAKTELQWNLNFINCQFLGI